MAFLRLIPALLGILLFLAVAKGWLGDLDGGQRAGSRALRPAPPAPDFSRWAARPVVVPLRPGEVFLVPHDQLLFLEEISIRGTATGDPQEQVPLALLLLRHPAGGFSELSVGAGAWHCESSECSAGRVTRAPLVPGVQIRLQVESLEGVEARLEGRLFQIPRESRGPSAQPGVEHRAGGLAST